MGLKSDSVGIRTQDPQLRRLLLYPAELRNHSRYGTANIAIFLLPPPKGTDYSVPVTLQPDKPDDGASCHVTTWHLEFHHLAIAGLSEKCP